MIHRSLIATLAAGGLVLASTAAIAAPTARKAATVERADSLVGTFLLPLLALAAGVLGTALVLGDDDAPVSP